MLARAFERRLTARARLKERAFNRHGWPGSLLPFRTLTVLANAFHSGGAALCTNCSDTSHPLSGLRTARQPIARRGMVTTKCTQTGGWTVNSNHMFVFVGADPNTHWLGGPFQLFGAARGDDRLGSEHAGDLQAEQRDTAGAEQQHRLASLQLAQCDQRRPRGHPRHREGRGLLHRQGHRGVDDGGGRRDPVFGQRALGVDAERVQPSLGVENGMAILPSEFR